MRQPPHVHNPDGYFQKTSNQRSKSQEARNPAGSFSEMSWLFRGRARNRARAKSACLSALRLSFCAVGEGTARKSARSRNLCGDGCHLKSVDILRFQGM